MNLSITTAQQVTVRLSPKTQSGKSATPVGKPRWSVNSGGCSIAPAADGLSCVIVSGANAGDSVVEVAADFGAGTTLKTLTDAVNVAVTAVVIDPPPPPPPVDDPVTTLGLTADAPVLKAVTPPPPPPPTGDDAAILAKYRDSTVPGMDARLGPKATGANPAPDVWTRGQVPTTDLGWLEGAPPMAMLSEGLSIIAPPPPVTNPPTDKPWYDFGSDELNIAAVDDAELVVNPSNPSAVNSDGGPGPQGLGVYRLRLEEHSHGGIQMKPVIPWNEPETVPDKRAVMGHTASFGMGNKLGRCIQQARGRVNRYDGGFGLYDKARGGMAYIGTMCTNTAWSAWAGEQLDDNFIPLCMAVSSQNEFLFVGVHDGSTNTGKLVVVVNWGSLNAGEGQFPFDFREPMPGLVQSGVVLGMKIIGTVDLPVKWPTSISVATSRSWNDRIEGADGNAAYLRDWDLSTKALRDLFLAKNRGWIADWGEIVIASKEENKVVQVDATTLYQGYRDQYFTTDEKWAASRPQNPGESWWKVYNTADQSVWPNMAASFTPTVTRTIDLTRPTVAWMLETNDGAFVVGDEAGVLHWYKDDGSVDGTLQLGANITSIRDDKYKGGVRTGNLVVTSRGARTVYGVTGKEVKWQLNDQKLGDPVDAGTADTHGIEDRSIWVLDFSGKRVCHYRNTKIVLATQGGGILGTGPTTQADKAAYDAALAAQAAGGTDPLPPIREDLEFLGSFDLPGHPVSGTDSNVN